MRKRSILMRNRDLQVDRDVYRAAQWAVRGAVNRAVGWDVDEAVFRAVVCAVGKAVSWAMHRAVVSAEDDSDHPGLQDFLVSCGAGVKV